MADSHDKEIYKRPYNRPNENWVCGLSAEGKPCPHGPSRRGKCAVHYECVPAKLNDRWVCTRPEQYGGPCDSPALEEPAFGPAVRDGVGECCKKVHCSPQRSLRNLRGRVSIVICLILVGGALTALGGAWRTQFLSPGPLTVSHQGASMASLEEMTHGKLDSSASTGIEGESCHICHTSVEGGLEGLLSAAVKGNSSVTQSAQCLVCHQDDVGNSGLSPHALSADVMATHTAEAQADPFSASKPLSLMLASFTPGVKLGDSSQLACATCHHEHNGAFFDIKRMENENCQVCHVKQFKSINQGHPEFATLASKAGYDYPYRRRTRIVFDHERHETNYFQKDGFSAHAPADCTSCHEIAGETFTTRLKAFEEMCSACHNGSIVSARDEWIPVFGFPSVESDVYEILEDELELSAIPRTASKKISPIMMLLLAGYNAQDPKSQAQFTEDFAMVQEFEGDLSGIAYDEDPEIVGRLFEGLKFLQGDAMNEDQGGLRQVIQEQLERVKGGPISSGELDALFGYPELGSTVEKVVEDISRKDIIEMSGWHVRESEFRLDPAGWLSAIDTVAPYRALRDAAAEDGAGAYEKVLSLFSDYEAFREWFDTQFKVEGEDWILVSSGKGVKNKEWKGLITGMVGASAASATESAEEPAEGDDEAAAKDTPEENSDGAADAAPDKAVPAEVDPDSAIHEVGEAFVAWFGDFRDFKKWLEGTATVSGETWALREPRSMYYRPIKHADPFITAWLDFSASLYAKSPAAAMVFDELSGRATGSAIGACMKCHSIDAEKNAAGDPVVKVNWKSEQPIRDFTKFNHTPHLKLMNCAECHRAPWVPAVQARMTVAKAASAEEEAVTTAGDGAVAPETEREAEESPAVEEASPESEVSAAAPAMAYLDSFKASTEGLELGVNFSNANHGSSGHAFVSNFEPVAKGDCARCHVQGKAGDSCLICHNYHIKEQNLSMGIQSLRDLIANEPAPAEAQ